MPLAQAGLSLSDDESYKGWRAEVCRFLDAEIDRSGLSASLQEAIRCMADNSAGTKLGATPWLHKIQPVGVDGNVLIDFCRPAAAAIPCR
jgi:hypothetical protein